MNNKIAIKHIYITNDNFENKDIFLIHKNKYVEVTILIEFSGWLTVNGEVSYVSDGNVFVINRNVYHEISTKDKKGKAISLFIEGANEIFDTLENGYEIIDCNKHLRFVTDYIERLADKNLSDQIKHQVSDVVFNYLITELIFQKNKKNHTKNKLCFNQLREYLELNYNKHITLDGLERIFNYSKFYMEKRFRNEYGKSIGEYLITLRMGQAQLLLVSTDTPVKEIAEEVGYYNVSQFNTLFKKRFELTPSDYRKKYKNSLNEGVK